IYGPGEEEYPRKVQSMMKQRALPEYPHSGIARMRGIFERATLHIGCDNGPANIAKASPCSTIVLYSNSRASSWTPPGNPRYITLENDVPCKSKCLHERCKNPICVTNTTVDEVLEATKRVLI
ncbi:MAG: hypothetical protein LBV09_03430, partial [Deferribacteraceae bacterium]|nr:hypothetical protein [Deferribacteraceae bacterium]